LDNKAQEVEDVTEIADVVQDVDEDENIQREVGFHDVQTKCYLHGISWNAWLLPQRHV
jgi:hypothetical protein